jgi:hypothetical protein
MDRSLQIQCILLRLTGTPRESLPACFELDAPWGPILHRVRPAYSRDEAASLLTYAAGPDGGEPLAELIALLPEDDAFPKRLEPPPEPSRRPRNRYPPLRDMPPDLAEVKWLWPSWIPRGMVTLLAAAPGAGKSLVALDLARRIIRGEPFPDGAAIPQPGSSVLLVDAEGAPGLLRQRVEAWQIDPGLLFLWASTGSLHPVDLGTLDQMKRLLDMCSVIGPALVIVDSLASAAPRTETSVKAAREVLGSLSTVAHTLGLALLVIHHLRKGHAGSALHPPTAYDLRGSSHLTAAARSILMLSPEAAPGHASAPDPNGPRRLAVVKSNLGRLPRPLSLALEERPGAPLLSYSPLVEPSPPPTLEQLCEEWLVQYLAEVGEPVRPVEVVEEAWTAGFSRRTLYRARRALAAAVVDVGTSPRDPHKAWALAPLP